MLSVWYFHSGRFQFLLEDILAQLFIFPGHFSSIYNKSKSIETHLWDWLARKKTWKGPSIAFPPLAMLSSQALLSLWTFHAHLTRVVGLFTRAKLGPKTTRRANLKCLISWSGLQVANYCFFTVPWEGIIGFLGQNSWWIILYIPSPCVTASHLTAYVLVREGIAGVAYHSFLRQV